MAYYASVELEVVALVAAVDQPVATVAAVAVIVPVLAAELPSLTPASPHDDSMVAAAVAASDLESTMLVTATPSGRPCAAP